MLRLIRLRLWKCFQDFAVEAAVGEEQAEAVSLLHILHAFQHVAVFVGREDIAAGEDTARGRFKSGSRLFR